MIRRKSMFDDLALLLIVLFLGLVALIFSQVEGLFLVFWVPVVTYFLWRTYTRTKALESRLSKLEKPSEESKPDGA